MWEATKYAKTIRIPYTFKKDLGSARILAACNGFKTVADYTSYLGCVVSDIVPAMTNIIVSGFDPKLTQSLLKTHRHA
ncbi:uncharacterized protein FIESC28_02830 [Fusarium coffeatum]|uniref:Uncharacterized protein n=1 Tax=Fusarium coffeatum TaxID=231269 RepID=A0A366S6M9_9HYPO|nr:uncharacterized protein FIESC28_02830 [Fusarium coffeatum]RBR24340.1 hypothetical protein FIESC28_02830 [Fusarium coffeatum]